MAGEHTVDGSVIIKTGAPGVEIVTGTDSAEVHPEAFVTLNVNTPPSRLVIVLLMPVPVVVTEPGSCVITHVPDDGNPLNTTLPVGTANVGWVIVPTAGAVGEDGCAGINTFADGTDKHPSAVVTVKLYDPEGRPAIVELVPVPDVETVPGYRINVQVPDDGKPSNITLPVDTAQVGGVIAPMEGAAGIGGCTLTKTFPDGEEIQPVELVTVKVYVPAGSAEIVAVVPVPENVRPPGVLVNVQLPVTGNPLKTTVPVDIAHVG